MHSRPALTCLHALPQLWSWLRRRGDPASCLLQGIFAAAASAAPAVVVIDEAEVLGAARSGGCSSGSSSDAGAARARTLAALLAALDGLHTGSAPAALLPDADLLAALLRPGPGGVAVSQTAVAGRASAPVGHTWAI